MRTPIPIGKTNLDQFATGLVGTRSPFGTPRNPFDSRFIPGGSSSGSAAAVSAGLVSFALGTDTAGSGRVPAGFNNVIGLKPSCGRLSTAGVVPACRSIDCVSIFSLTCGDAAEVLDVAAGFDPQDPYSRNDWQIPQVSRTFPGNFRFGVPADSQLRFFEDRDSEALYRAAIARLEALGGKAVVIDFSPFVAAGALLYEGAWVAERVAGLREFISGKPDSVLPLTRGILQSGRRFDAVGAFDCIHELRTLARLTANEWMKMDVLLLPTTGTIYSLAEIEAAPLLPQREPWLLHHVHQSPGSVRRCGSRRIPRKWAADGRDPHGACGTRGPSADHGGSIAPQRQYWLGSLEMPAFRGSFATESEYRFREAGGRRGASFLVSRSIIN